MSRTVYINGEFLPIDQAKIPVMDRGFLFADSVYEVSAIINGKLVDNAAHLKRLERSLKELNIPMPVSGAEIEKAQIELIKQNNVVEGCIYLQVTRGTFEREFTYPDNLKPNLVMFTQVKNIQNSPYRKTGVKVVSLPDIRWERRDIKSTALLAQVLAKSEASRLGAYEALMHENGVVTEGGSSNVGIIKNKTLITRGLSNKILHGITRAATLKLAQENQLKFEERDFTLDEVYAADECFLTSATNFVIGVVEADGKKIGNGQVGELTQRLYELYIKEISK